jgi:hypothetical protein
MYAINRYPYGFKITFGGSINADEMSQWLKDAERQLTSQTGSFGVMVDMRDLKPLAPDAQAVLQTGQKLFKAKGMQRSAVILQNPIITLQFKRLAQETGISAWERYLDASKSPAWESAATSWLKSGVDPE